MNYVDNFDLFGVPAKQIPCNKGSGAPTTSTEGAVGCFYMDTDTGDVYKCTAAVDGVFEWVNNNSGDNIRWNNVNDECLVSIDKNGNSVQMSISEAFEFGIDFINELDNLYDNETMYTPKSWYVHRSADNKAIFEQNSYTHAYIAIAIPVYGLHSITLFAYKDYYTVYRWFVVDSSDTILAVSVAGLNHRLDKNPLTIELPNNTRAIYLSVTLASEGAPHLMVNSGTKPSPFKTYEGPYAVKRVFKQKNDVELTLPSKFNLVVGDTFELFWNGVLKCHDIDAYYIEAACSKGRPYRKRFIYTPEISDIGEHTMTVKVYDKMHVLVATGRTTLSVKDKAISPMNETVVLYVGDSLTNGGQVPDEFFRRLTTLDGSPTGDGLTNITFVGTCTSNRNNTPYEGHPGWTWSSYNSNYGNENPFWDATSESINISKYVQAQGKNTLDYVYVLLGWNSMSATDESIRGDAETFIHNILTFYPNCKITLLGLQMPSRDGLGENYGASETWTYYAAMNHVVRINRIYSELADRLSNVYFVNISGQFDTEHGMPVNTRAVNVRSTSTEQYQSNGIHPMACGYYQIADACYRDFVHKLQD